MAARPPAPETGSDHGLRAYRAKRHFDRTPEPTGGSTSERGDGAPGGRFVVQRHQARRLHYDLRLEMGGVLASWAVPRGPTLDPTVKRMAVHVEDHPIEYLDFEGVIPHGEYGGGDVIVWDRGRWELGDGDDPIARIEAGELHFDLEGEKLAGRFVLLRRGRDGDPSRDWLLLHKRDDAAVDGWDPEAHPHSVLSGRTNEEVAAAPRALWRSDKPAAEAEEIVADAAGPEPVPGPTDDELAALDGLGPSGAWELQGRVLELTNLDKALFPATAGEAALTKRDLIRHYARMAPWIVPYLVDRPVNMHRYPDGVERPGFWHKEVPSHAPSWLRRWHNDEADPGETEWYLVPDGAPAMAWLANYGAVEVHPWTSRIPRVHEPSWALIDIDPGPALGFDDVLVLARLYRTALEHLDVRAGPKVTGKRGIQIWVPVAPGYRFSDTRAWVERISRAIGATVPELVSWRWQKDEREGRARLDYTQNAINKTLVAPWAVRPAARGPVSVPITWDELDDPDLRPDRWTIRTTPERLRLVGDPLRPLVGVAQRLPEL